jgi:dephospho-CoA kinase
MSRAILIAGEICSGKDTMVANHYSKFPYVQIDLGNLVRERFQTEERIFNNELEPYFIQRIIDTIERDNDIHGRDVIKYVVTGLRQPTLCEKIAQLFNIVEYKYLVAPRSILKQRYLNRAAVKDAKITFEQAIAGDESLGMKLLQNYLLTEVECDFIKSY